MIKSHRISLILPCKNEAHALAMVLPKIPNCIDEVIVVDNNSTDKTPSVAKKYHTQVIREQRHEHGIGYGYALQTGIQTAKGDILICMDGDDSYPISLIPELVEKFLKEKKDMVVCSRMKQSNKLTRIRTLGITLCNWLIYLLFQKRIADSLSGMWIIKRSLAQRSRFKQGGWNLSLEIKLLALRSKHIRFGEYAIPYTGRIYDISKQQLLRTGFEHMLFLLRQRFS